MKRKTWSWEVLIGMNTFLYLEMLKSGGDLEREKFTVTLLSITDTMRPKVEMSQLSWNKATPERQQL